MTRPRHACSGDGGFRTVTPPARTAAEGIEASDVEGESALAVPVDLAVW